MKNLLSSLKPRSFAFAQDDNAFAQDDNAFAQDDNAFAQDDNAFAQDDNAFAQDDKKIVFIKLGYFSGLVGSLSPTPKAAPRLSWSRLCSSQPASSGRLSIFCRAFSSAFITWSPLIHVACNLFFKNYSSSVNYFF
jgi:hypothetical protein